MLALKIKQKNVFEAKTRLIFKFDLLKFSHNENIKYINVCS